MTSISDIDTASLNRKRIDDLFVALNDIIASASSEENSINLLVDYLSKCDFAISSLIDAEKNTGKPDIDFILVVLQISVNDLQFRHAVVITEAYYRHLSLNKGQADLFANWLLNDNILKQNVYELIVENNHKELFQSLCKYITIGIANQLLSDRMNVLHYAAKTKNISALLYFYDIFDRQHHIPDCINKSSLKNQLKPIHSACYSDDHKTVDILIDLGADINATDYMGMTPLHIAVILSNARIAKKLILHGANKNLKNTQDKTPYELSINSRNPELVDVLAKKSFIRTLIKCDIEYISLKNRRRDYGLIGIILLTLCIKLSLYTLLHIKVEGDSDESYCLITSTNCLTESLLFFFGIVFELAMMCFVLFFSMLLDKCKGVSIDRLEQIEVEEQKTLCELYVQNEDFCVRCRRNKPESTLHCISCDTCIEHWDHHCFYLNCCIHSGNKKYFKAFCFVSCGAALVNAVNFCIYFVIVCLENSKAIIGFIFSVDSTASIVIAMRVISGIALVVLVIGSIYAAGSMVIPFMIADKEKKKDDNPSISSRTALINDF